MDAYKVSEEVCMHYRDGRQCPREKRSGSCPYIHNINDHEEAIAARLAKSQLSKENVIAERAQEQVKLHQQRVAKQLNTNGTDSVNTSKLTAANNVKVRQSKPKAAKPVTAKKAATTSRSAITSTGISTESKPTVSKCVPLAGSNGHPLTPPSSEAGDTLPEETVLETFPLSPPQTPPRVLTQPPVAVNSNSPQLINGIWQSKYTNTKELCRNFLKLHGGCRNSKCRFTHDQNARARHLDELTRLANQKRYAKLELIKNIPAAEANYEENAKILADLATTEANVTALASSTLSTADASVGNTPGHFSSSADSSTLPKESFWGGQESMAIWAKNNVYSHTQLKLLAPYFGLQKIPANIVATVRNLPRSDASDAFHFFQCLPGELRNQIWEYAIENEIGKGRKIRLQYHCDRFIGAEPVGGKIVCRTFSPALLNVCHESRSLMGPYCNATFFNPVIEPRMPVNYTIINLEIDQLFLHANGPLQLHRMVRLMGEEICASVKHLVIPLKEYLGDRSKEMDYLGPLLSHFCNLKSLDMMVGDGFQDLSFQKKRYCEDVKDVMYHYLKKRFHIKHPELPKVGYAVIPAVRAHDFGIDELLYMGEGGRGTYKNGW
ncbi:hypothetical protein VTL71DRAFT_14158 [Oculimacula yallundae]|uniref:C3H1-type domain-containing protein n=1 Tax=Oculimacula yallundae TaxID=86028 RepID=A0ABR4CI91_9HELO